MTGTVGTDDDGHAGGIPDGGQPPSRLIERHDGHGRSTSTQVPGKPPNEHSCGQGGREGVSVGKVGKRAAEERAGEGHA